MLVHWVSADVSIGLRNSAMIGRGVANANMQTWWIRVDCERAVHAYEL